jgi:hypothetical protein
MKKLSVEKMESVQGGIDYCHLFQSIMTICMDNRDAGCMSNAGMGISYWCIAIK